MKVYERYEGEGMKMSENVGDGRRLKGITVLHAAILGLLASIKESMPNSGVRERTVFQITISLDNLGEV